jgi:hypothetical protein
MLRSNLLLKPLVTVAIGHGNPSFLSLNWNSLGLPTPNLDGLDDPFSEEEVRKTIMDMPSDEVPGLDGFNGKFFKTCWDIIKCDGATLLLPSY